jgi:hypothetical protein
MKEFRTLNVAPGGENEAIAFWQHFGWELTGAPQETLNKSSPLKKDGDNINRAAETTRYIKLSFQRDTAMDHYTELASLQREYEAIPNAFAPLKRFNLFFLTIMGLSLFLSFLSIKNRDFRQATDTIAGFVLPLVFLAPGVLVFIWRMVHYKKLYPVWESAVKDIADRREDVLKRAEALMQQG